MSLSVFVAAAEAPDRVALVAGHTTLTYAELVQGVRGAVAWLRNRGLDGEEPVALVAGNDLPTLEMVHALIALGTPALLLHPRLTAPERASLLEAAGRAAVVDPDWRRAVPRDAGAAPHSSPSPAAGSPDAADPPPPAAPERPLAIVHTSGTSGRPRGVVLSRRAFAASAAASASNLGWREDDRWLLPLPVAHVGGLSIVTRCLLARRTVVLTDDPRPEPLLDTVRRHRVTLLSLVPTVLARILDRDPPPPPPDHLRAVLLGGAAASPALLERAADAGWPVLTTYGQTEACSQATTQPLGTVNRGELGSGPPLPGVELRVGADAAIQLRGPTLFSGYLPAADRSPFLEGGWFQTGDRGRLDDAGNLHVLGRRTDRIITGGENVDPVEVEQVLERLPGVGAACVFGVPDDEWGEVVCAAIVVGGSRAAAEREILEAVRALEAVLAPFKWPRRVAFLESLPLNATGKVDRRATARLAAGRLQSL